MSKVARFTLWSDIPLTQPASTDVIASSVFRLVEHPTTTLYPRRTVIHAVGGACVSVTETAAEVMDALGLFMFSKPHMGGDKPGDSGRALGAGETKNRYHDGQPVGA